MPDRPRFTTDRPDGRFLTTAGFVHAYLKNLKPKLAFDPDRKPEEVPAWQEAVREKLRELMCFPKEGLGFSSAHAVATQPEPKHLWSEQREGYELQKWEAYPEPLSVVPYLVLVPDGVSESSPAPAVMCFPGSTSSKESLAGELEPVGSTSDHPHWARNRMAMWYAREGLVAVAVDNPGIGELKDPLTQERTEIVCTGLWAGRHYEGLSVFGKLPILEWVKRQHYVDASRIATSGHSLGAKPALIVGVLEPSIAAVVWNDFCSNWRERAVAENLLPISRHQYVPGFHEWFDYTDLMASLAPRPLCITEGGRTRDIERIRDAFKLVGAEDRMHVAYYPKYATPDLRPYDDVDLPEGLTMEEYFEYANVDVPEHSFKPDAAVPWLTETLR